MLRGDVVLARGAPGAGVPDELLVVVQADALAELPTVVVVPARAGADGAPHRATVTVGGGSRVVCCDLVRAVPRAGLGAIVARLDPAAQRAVDAALAAVLAAGLTRRA